METTISCKVTITHRVDAQNGVLLRVELEGGSAYGGFIPKDLIQLLESRVSTIFDKKLIEMIRQYCKDNVIKL